MVDQADSAGGTDLRGRRAPDGGPRAPFVEAVLRTHRRWAVDGVATGRLPRGWLPLAFAAFAALESAMAEGAPRRRVRVDRLDEHDGRLRIVVREDPSRLVPPRVTREIEAVVAAAAAESADRCPRCGRLLGSVRPEGDGMAAHRVAEPDCRPSADMAEVLSKLEAWAGEASAPGGAATRRDARAARRADPSFRGRAALRRGATDRRRR